MASLVAIKASSTIGVAAFCMRTLLTAGHPELPYRKGRSGRHMTCFSSCDHGDRVSEYADGFAALNGSGSPLLDCVVDKGLGVQGLAGGVPAQ
eukprot:753799-Heterocapsa_arctica.AAC.1